MRIALPLPAALAAALIAAAVALPAQAQTAPAREGDRTASLDTARQERKLVASCGAEWDAMKRKGSAGQDLTWRRFWESCRTR